MRHGELSLGAFGEGFADRRHPHTYLHELMLTGIAVPGAGAHHFSVDEQNGILYAAYYNGGVRALDVRGDLGTCLDLQRVTPPAGVKPLCDLERMGREIGVELLDRGNPV